MIYKSYTIITDRWPYPERCTAWPTEEGEDMDNQLNGTVEDIKAEIDELESESTPPKYKPLVVDGQFEGMIKV